MRPISSCDWRLINEVAEIWVQSGGDALGLDFVYSALRETIDRLYTEKQNADESRIS